jgi:transposase-like protein
MTNSTNQETITFYDVPLVCGAAPSIGCGSRAKPLLIDLEQQAPIKEAWLNRTGTIVAIAWRGQADMEKVGKPVFERHEIEYTERRDDKQTTGSFRIEGSWLRGAEVDRLSLEEAREIAETSVASAAKERLVSREEAAQIKSEIEAYFRKELLKVRTKQELLQDARGKFREAILNIYEKHVGVERTAEAQARGIQNPFDRADREKTSRCCP